MDKIISLILTIQTTSILAQSTGLCDVMIDKIYLDGLTTNIGDTIIIEAHNQGTQNIFSYPGFKVYIIKNGANVLFGEDNVNYYGIGGYSQDFKIKSNTNSIIKQGEQIELYIELYSFFFDTKECIFNWSGTINLKEPLARRLLKQLNCPLHIGGFHDHTTPCECYNGILVEACPVQRCKK
eukprot:879099_1